MVLLQSRKISIVSGSATLLRTSPAGAQLGEGLQAKILKMKTVKEKKKIQRWTSMRLTTVPLVSVSEELAVWRRISLVMLSTVEFSLLA